MRVIELDASGWTDGLVFYDALLKALEAPPWHGRNLNALIDSIVWGDINGIEPPYTIRIYKLSQAAPDAREEFKIFLKYLPECKAEYFAREGRPREVYFEIMT